jgi:hypothetical protein
MTLIVLIMGVKFFAPLHHTLVDRVAEAPFNFHCNGFLHSVTHYLTEQDFPSELCHEPLSLHPPCLLELALTLNCFDPRHIPPYCGDTAHLLNLTGSELETEVEEFFNKLLTFLS